MYWQATPSLSLLHTMSGMCFCAGFDVDAAKALFFDIYINRYCKGESKVDIGYPGAVQLVRACRAAGLKTAVASSAEYVKVSEVYGLALYILYISCSLYN